MTWTWVDDKEVEHDEGAAAELDELARRRAELLREREELGWERERRRDDPGYDGPTEAEDVRAFQVREQTSERLRDAQLRSIEDRMAELGARPRRPYEHWNEDERLMRYLEGEG